MFIKDQVIVAFSTFMLGVSSFAVSAQTAIQQCSSEDCACEEALKQNTVEALEDFLRKYPQAANGTSACAALGVPPQDEGADSQGSGDAHTPVQPDDSSYGG